MNWISVEERLPKSGEWVIVVISGVVQRQAARLGDKYWSWADDSGDSAPREAVSYWMPLPDPPVEYPSSPQQVKRDDNWSVKELIETAEKLLEWMPIYSKGSSGNIRQTNLRAAIEKFKVEHPEPAKGGTE